LQKPAKNTTLKLGLYYSHWVDWEHEYGWDHTREITGIAPEDYDNTGRRR
jgi:alpha-L-fucosidase